LVIKEKLGNKSSIAHTWTEEADLIRLQAVYADSAEQKAHAYQQSRALLMKSLQINEEIPDMLDVAYTKYILGRVALDEGNVDEAQQLCTQAKEIWTRYNDEAALSGCSYLAGLIAERVGDRGKAAELFQAALDVWQDRGLVAAEYARKALDRVGGATS
jgi:tetratricopeptide (TPR) repeat protein